LGSFDEESDEENAHDGALPKGPSEEVRAAFEERLLLEDMEGARLQAMHFAMARVHKKQAMARQMADDALRLCWERCTWDPQKVTLGEYLVGVVRSEWSRLARDKGTERRDEEDYLTEQATLAGTSGASPEDAAIALEDSAEGEAAALRLLGEMKAHFEKTGDTVNLERMQFMADEIDSPAEMTKRSGRPVEDYYRAADRCARLKRKLLARPKE
jgi:hypothetical protein